MFGGCAGDVECHLYGSYPSATDFALTDASSGLIVKGSVDNQYDMLSKYVHSLPVVALVRVMTRMVVQI